jgi:hypothetical protein
MEILQPLCLHRCPLANILNLTQCFKCLTGGLPVISHEPSSLRFTDSLATDSSLLCTALHCLTNLPCYNTSARTALKTPFLSCSIFLTRNLLPSSGRFVIRFAVVAYQRIYTQQYGSPNTDLSISSDVATKRPALLTEAYLGSPRFLQNEMISSHLLYP